MNDIEVNFTIPDEEIEIDTFSTEDFDFDIFAVKGDKGDTGSTGLTPNISATASISGGVGTPSVSVTRSGSDEEPTLAFAFSNLKGDKGDPGAIKFEIVVTLPTQNIKEDTIYLVPITPDESDNNYKEYIYVNGSWELLGKIAVHVDLTDYVKNTDYATSSKGGVIKSGNSLLLSNGTVYAGTLTYADYQVLGSERFIGKGTLENVITGKGLTTKSYVDGLVGDINSALDSINGEII